MEETSDKKIVHQYYDLVKLFFKNKTSRQFYQYNFDSFDQYIEDILQLLQQEESNIIAIKNQPDGSSIQLRMKIINPQVMNYPIHNEIMLTPQMAQLYELTYSVGLTFDKIQFIKYEYDSEGRVKIDQLLTLSNTSRNTLFNIPIPVGCQLCSSKYVNQLISDDCPGGYFIINGKQKIVVPLERTNTNEVIIYKEASGTLVANVNSKSFHDQNTNMSILQVCAKISTDRIIQQSDDQLQVNDYAYMMSDEIQEEVSLLKKKNQQQFFNITFQSRQFNQDNKKNRDLPVFILFAALGYCKDKDIIELCSCGNEKIKQFLIILLQNYKKMSQFRNIGQADAISLLDSLKSSKIKQKSISQILFDNILQHTQNDQNSLLNYQYKAEFLGYMVYKLLLVCTGQAKLYNRDSYRYKRLNTIGQLMFQITEESYKKNIKKNRRQFQDIDISTDSLKQNIQIVHDFLYKNDISVKLQQHIQRGIWSSAKLKGVSQQYYSGSLFQMQLQCKKISNNPSFGEQRETKFNQRLIEPNTNGYLANEESVEGANIGSNIFLALSTDVSVDYNKLIPQITSIFTSNREIYGLSKYKPSENSSLTKLLIQGDLKFVIEKPHIFIKFFENLRRRQIIPQAISYFVDETFDEIFIYTDQGRYLRPVICVDDNNNSMVTDADLKDIQAGKYDTFEDFINRNPQKIHYLELREAQCHLIAENISILEYAQKQKQASLLNVNNQSKNIFKYSYPKYKYLDIHPIFCTGVVSSATVFASHNSSVRNTHCVAHKKKAIQQPIPESFFNLIKKVYYLVGGERPIIRTCVSDLTKVTKYPSGHQIQVMFTMHQGLDQEDSIIFRQQSAQMLYLQTFEDIYSTEVQRKSQEVVQKFMKITDKDKNDKYNYQKIDEDGMIQPGTIVHKNDIIIGKVEQIVTGQQQFINHDLSINFDGNCGIVTQVIKTMTKDGSERVVIKIKQYNFPQIGDKFAVGCGQKATISKILPDFKIPFFEDGTQPDITFNIHSQPTRKTLGLLYEGLLSQYASEQCQLIDASPFTSSLDLVMKAIEYFKKSKMRGIYLDEFMQTNRIDNITFEPCGKVFKAVFYYHALSQKPQDKIQSVGSGCASKQLFSRSLVSGKKRHGAIRFLEEMSKSSFTAWGNPFISYELSAFHSDYEKFYICDQCNQIADKDIQSNIYYCKNCDGKSQLKLVQMSYALMQLKRILQAMGIKLQLIPGKTIKEIINENQAIIDNNDSDKIQEISDEESDQEEYKNQQQVSDEQQLIVDDEEEDNQQFDDDDDDDGDNLSMQSKKQYEDSIYDQ